MASEQSWRKLPLEEAGVTLIDCDHRTPPAADSGYPYIAIPQLKDGQIELAGVRRISESDYLEWTRKLKPQANDVIVVRRCNSGDSAVVPEGMDCAIGQNLVVLRSDGSVIEPAYLRWLVRGSEWWAEVKKYINVGAVFDSLRCRDIPKFQLSVPPRREQIAIAQTLDAIDGQIQLLRQTNTTLEAIAQAIFRSWFIDFDPVRAKSQGRTPDGIDETAAALFPEAFEESMLGPIPRGWSATPLGDVLIPSADKVGSLHVPEYASTNDGLVPREKLFNKKLSKSAVNNKLIRRGDLVFGLSRATLNYGQMNDEIGSVSSAYKVFHVNPVRVLPQLLGRLISTRKEYFFNAVSASSREGQSVSTSSLERLQFACPPMRVQEALNSLLQPFVGLVECNIQEIATLIEIRHRLLPRLISGKLKLPELEEMAEAL